MSPREAFKFEFIKTCQDHGLRTPQQILDRLQAFAKAAGLGEAISGRWNTAWPIAMALPPAAGAIAGHVAAKATDISDFDVEEAKKQEIIDEYKRQADRLRREGQLRRFAAGGTGHPVRPAQLL